jgi:hypothetical protein
MLIAVVLFAPAFFATGCMSYTLRAGDSDVTPDRAHHVTMHSIVWGAVVDDFDATTQAYCANAGAGTVRVQDNFGYTVLNVLTLGFWHPMDIYFTCAVPSGPIGDPLGGG